MGKAVPARLSQRGAGFSPSPVRVKFVVGKVALEKVYLPVLRYSLSVSSHHRSTFTHCYQLTRTLTHLPLPHDGGHSIRFPFPTYSRTFNNPVSWLSHSTVTILHNATRNKESNFIMNFPLWNWRFLWRHSNPLHLLPSHLMTTCYVKTRHGSKQAAAPTTMAGLHFHEFCCPKLWRLQYNKCKLLLLLYNCES